MRTWIRTLLCLLLGSLAAYVSFGWPACLVVAVSLLFVGLAVRLCWLSKLEASLQKVLFPSPREGRSRSRGQYRYRRGGPRRSFHQGHSLPPRLSAREMARDPRRDQVISAVVDDLSLQTETQLAEASSSRSPAPLLLLSAADHELQAELQPEARQAA